MIIQARPGAMLCEHKTSNAISPDNSNHDSRTMKAIAVSLADVMH